jgi:hypothetical protein
VQENVDHISVIWHSTNDERPLQRINSFRVLNLAALKRIHKGYHYAVCSIEFYV